MWTSKRLYVQAAKYGWGVSIYLNRYNISDVVAIAKEMKSGTTLTLLIAIGDVADPPKEGTSAGFTQIRTEELDNLAKAIPEGVTVVFNQVRLKDGLFEGMGTLI